MNAYRYSVDQQDRLTSVDDAWLAFAQTNDAPCISRDSVIGRPLFDFIDGQESREIYRELLSIVRHTGKRPSIPFRCDSPDKRRYMELHMTRQPGDHVEFEGKLIHEERRPRAELLDTNRPTSEYELTICSWCKRFGVDDGWLEVEEAMRELDLFGWAVMPRLRNDVCDRCSVMLQREISALSSE